MPSPLEQAMEEGVSLPALQQALRYSCCKERLGPELASVFVELSASKRTLDFLHSHPPHSIPASWARAVAGWFVSNADANAALSMYRMHVLDIDSAALLLDLSPPSSVSSQESPAARPLRLLDVGAGDGQVTAELAPLFGEVLATEVSLPCVRAIRKRGIACERTADLSTLGSRHFDVVACLNVLDRCSRPLDLLADLCRLTEPRSGRVLLAVVLPFSPWVECGGMGRRKRPEQHLALNPRAQWEEAVKELSSLVLQPAGFEILKISRVPYLCQGDASSSVYTLDDAVFVLRLSPELNPLS
eukprot:CAMPEP_0179447048 /NCGR_PEP_ID=MMETSP0799-20121207/30775_1 /TAXON_ID=46947 /ORGANISM="Geminigera cryophila, Strain CCMP2564" /LENGTH=300 /DNA_ID=CAMNT_0021237263 /DNA_START=160 /DNA_END=1062 /DNA_ORIENTATION=-